MDKIGNFLKEPSMEKLERLRKSKIVKIDEKLELNVQKTMRKHELVRKIAHGGRKCVRGSSIRRATNRNDKNDTRTNWTGENHLNKKDKVMR